MIMVIEKLRDEHTSERYEEHLYHLKRIQQAIESNIASEAHEELLHSIVIAITAREKDQEVMHKMARKMITMEDKLNEMTDEMAGMKAEIMKESKGKN